MEYASNGKANAGLALGIIGTSLAGLLWANDAKKATFHRIATEEMGHYKALHDIIFASAETPFEKAFKDESEKCYIHMMKKVQTK